MPRENPAVKKLPEMRPEKRPEKRRPVGCTNDTMSFTPGKLIFPVFRKKPFPRPAKIRLTENSKELKQPCPVKTI